MELDRNNVRWAVWASVTIALAAFMVACEADPKPTPVGRTPNDQATQTPVPSAPSPTQEPIDIGPGAAPIKSTSASAVSFSPSGDLLAAVNPDSNSVSIVDPTGLVRLGEVSVGIDPRTVAFSPDGSVAYVTNFGSGTVSKLDPISMGVEEEWVVGPKPYGVVATAQSVFVTHLLTDTITVLRAGTGEVSDRMTVGAFPAGMALADEAQTLLVTHLYSGELTAIDTESLSVAWVLSTGVDSNLSQFVIVGPDEQFAYLPQTKTNTENPYMVFDDTVFPVVNAVDLTSAQLSRSGRITLDTADEPVNMPFAMAISADASSAFIANAGSNDVSIIDLATGRGLGHIDVGANPRGIAMSPDGARVFVNNVLDGTLSVIDTASLKVQQTIELTEIPLSPTVLLGKQLFNKSRGDEVSRDGWISCATCHFDGMHDGRTWLGFPDGPRNTPSLLGVSETLPIHWSGDLDELADVELTVRAIQHGTGLTPGEALDSLGVSYGSISPELDALAEFLGTLDLVSLPSTLDSATSRDGEAVFERSGCAECHGAPLYTDLLLHDVGTGDPALEKNSHGRGTMFDTPSLRGINLTAPYFHDGSAPNLRAVFDETASSGLAHAVGGQLNDEDMDLLIAFVRSL